MSDNTSWNPSTTEDLINALQRVEESKTIYYAAVSYPEFNADQVIRVPKGDYHPEYFILHESILEPFREAAEANGWEAVDIKDHRLSEDDLRDAMIESSKRAFSEFSKKTNPWMRWKP